MSDEQEKQEKKSPPVLGPKPPSDDFMRAVVEDGGSSLEKQCEFCGITHFATRNEGEYWEWSDLGGDGSDDAPYLVHLREMAEEHPDWYIEHCNVDSIAWGNLNGKEIVWGCPCNAGFRYEQFIKYHAEMISEYLNSVAQRELEKATTDVQIAEKIKNSNYDLDRRISEAEKRREDLEKRQKELKDKVQRDQKSLRLKTENLKTTLLEERAKLEWEEERNKKVEKLIKEFENKRQEILMGRIEQTLNSSKKGRILDI